jgi:GntR family histidine utilization transcriptional repressor
MACAKPVPLYEQLKEHVLQNIRSGAWRAGERVPSEHDLVREFKVSRMTANRALRELMRSGVLARIAGVGTFVGDFKAAAHPQTRPSSPFAAGDTRARTAFADRARPARD